MDFRGSIRKAQISQQQHNEAGNKCMACMVLGASFCTILLVILIILAVSGLGIAKLVIGGLYFHDCELQPLLPIFLIVDACVGIVIGGGLKKKNDDDDSKCSPVTIIKVLTSLFLFIWLIFGTIWVVDVRNTIYAPDHCMATPTALPIDGNSTTMMTTQPMTTAEMTTMMNASATQPIGNDVTSSILLSAIGFNQSGSSGASMGEVECKTCSEVLTDFTFAVVVINWCLGGMAFLIIVLSVLGLLCANCAAVK